MSDFDWWAGTMYILGIGTGIWLGPMYREMARTIYRKLLAAMRAWREQA